MTGAPDHICSSNCVFCRILATPQHNKAVSGRSKVDPQLVERVKELEQRSILTGAQSSLASTRSDELEQLALLDSLTGLYNQRTFLKELKNELHRAKRYKRSLTL